MFAAEQIQSGENQRRYLNIGKLPENSQYNMQASSEYKILKGSKNQTTTNCCFYIETFLRTEKRCFLRFCRRNETRLNESF